MAVLAQVLTEEPPPPSKHRPDLDPALEAICLKAMAKKTAARYASMGELAAALTQYLRGAGAAPTAAVVAIPVGPAGKPSVAATALMAVPVGQPILRSAAAAAHGGRRRWPWLVAGGVGLAALAGFLLVGVVFKPRTKTEVAAPGASATDPPNPRPGAVLLRPGGLGGRYQPTRGQLLQEGGGTEESEAAVLRGLRWIVQQQLKDGRWTLGRYDPGYCDVPSGGYGAPTALALLPLLGAGHTPRTGAFAPQVARGIDFLLTRQQNDGSFASSAYQHGLPTIALCEAYALAADPKLKGPAQRALDFIVHAQHPAGGWRYVPGEPGDTSATGWALQALKIGQQAGLAVPDDALQRVSRFLDSVEHPGGGFDYLPGTGGTQAVWASGLLCRLHLGSDPQHPKVRKVVETLQQTPPAPSLKNVYYYYHATQALRHVGGAPWRTWNPKMRDWLLARQEKGQLVTDKTAQDRATQHAGSWSPVGDEFGKSGGRLYVTSLSLLTLEAYYRYVPLCRTSGLPLPSGEASDPKH